MTTYQGQHRAATTDSAVQSTGARTSGSEERPSASDPRGRIAAVAPLALVLVVQLTLSSRLLTTTAFTDEGLYLWAGRLEWEHWLNGQRIPPFPTYFSGAPIVYPPLAAIANHVDGLVGARALSIAFMLGATSLLWLVTSRLFGKTCGFFAASSWALLGPTIAVGTLATFDAMAMFLLAGAVWCVVHSAERYNFTAWTLAAAVTTILANAAAYSSVIFDPVVVAIAIAVGWPRPTRRVIAMRVSAICCYVLTGIVLILAAGSEFYVTGILRTVVNRAQGITPATAVVGQTVRWVAPVAVLALIGLAACVITHSTRSLNVMLVIVTLAILVVPIEQARIHTATSLYKHADMGAWFAAISAGYGAGTLLSLLRHPALRRSATAVVGAAAALLVPVTVAQARTLSSWPSTSLLLNALKPLVASTSGPLLVETPSPVRYYLDGQVAWERWSDTRNISLPDGRSEGSSADVTGEGNPQTYQPLIARGYFAIIALNMTSTPDLDRHLLRDLQLSGRYRRVATVPYSNGYYFVWELATLLKPDTPPPHPQLGPRTQAQPRASSTGRASQTPARRPSPGPLLPSASATILQGTRS